MIDNVRYMYYLSHLDTFDWKESVVPNDWLVVWSQFFSYTILYEPVVVGGGVQADSINPFRFLWIVDCEAVRGDWMMKISGVTEKLTPGVSQNGPEDLDKHTKFCGRYNTSKNDMQWYLVLEIPEDLIFFLGAALFRIDQGL